MRGPLLMVLMVCSACGSPQRTTPAAALTTDVRCREESACAQRGLCAAAGTRCVATREKQCQASVMCRRSGACSLRRGRCVVASDADCQRAEVCEHRGMCFSRDGGCASTCGPEAAGSVQPRSKATFEFYSKWRAVDDDEVSRFWKCLVRARHRDVRLAKDPQELTDGLEAAFKRYPRSQPGHLRKCLPLLAAARKRLLAICPPAGFPRSLGRIRKALQRSQDATLAYARRLARRSSVAAADKKLLAQGTAFHLAHDGKAGYAGALAYWNVLSCVMPDLAGQVRKIKKPPDTQYVVEYIYNRCGKRGVAPKAMAPKIRACFARRHRIKDIKNPKFRLGLKMLSSDNRDLMALKHCFKTVNRDLVARDVAPMRAAFEGYRKARQQLQNRMQQLKEGPGR